MPITINGSGTITGASTLATTVVSPTLATPNINSAQFATVTGTAPIYPCRAWVSFNGTGTVTINASGNVSSITDNGTGDYTVNFTVAMPDANYGFTTSSNSQVNVSSFSYTSIYPNTAPSASSLRVSIPGVVSDTSYNSVQIFR